MLVRGDPVTQCTRTSSLLLSSKIVKLVVGPRTSLCSLLLSCPFLLATLAQPPPLSTNIRSSPAVAIIDILQHQSETDNRASPQPRLVKPRAIRIWLPRPPTAPTIAGSTYTYRHHFISLLARVVSRRVVAAPRLSTATLWIPAILSTALSEPLSLHPQFPHPIQSPLSSAPAARRILLLVWPFC
jgi:hypothetical protein